MHIKHHYFTITAQSQGGGSDPAGDTGSQEGNNPTGENSQNGDVDYKAKYEDAIKHSREWESRAKANKSAADELKKLKEQNMSAEEKYEQIVKEFTALKADRQQEEWKAQVAQTTGVPAGLLRGCTLEEIQSHGEALKAAFSEAQKPQGGGMPHAGSQPKKTGVDDNRMFLRQLLGKQ